jgi:hypothetical protein
MEGQRKDKTQWHNVLGFGQGFAQMASRLVKGTHIFVQGGLTTREYDRTISVPIGKKFVDQSFSNSLSSSKLRRSAFSIALALLNRGKVAEPAIDCDVPCEVYFSFNRFGGSARLGALSCTCALSSSLRVDQ